LTNLTGGCWSQSNWAEVTNVREKSVRANLNFRNDRGQVLQSTEVTISPRAQFHFNGGILLPAGTVGSLQLSSSDPGALLSQSAVYYHDCQANTLQSSYATPGRIAGQDVQSGTFNTNLAMKNLLRVTSTTEATLSYATTLRSFNGFLAEQTSQLTSLRTNSIDTSAASSFATPTDLYGTLTIRTDAPRKFVAELLRLREVNGKVDFAMPTAVQ